MSRERSLRIQEFVRRLEATKRAALPPVAGAHGAADSEELAALAWAFEHLPADLQQALRVAYHRFATAFARRGGDAPEVQIARRVLHSATVRATTALLAHRAGRRVRDPSNAPPALPSAPARPATARDRDSAPVASAVVAVATDRQRPDLGIAGQALRVRARYLACAAFGTLACLLVLPHLSPPRTSDAPARAELLSIHRARTFGALTVIISHGLRTSDLTRVFVHLINGSDTPAPAALALEAVEDSDATAVTVESTDRAESDTAAAAGVVPARSIRHRVLTIGRNPGQDEDRLDLMIDGHAMSVPLGGQ